MHLQRCRVQDFHVSTGSGRPYPSNYYFYKPPHPTSCIKEAPYSSSYQIVLSILLLRHINVSLIMANFAARKAVLGMSKSSGYLYPKASELQRNSLAFFATSFTNEEHGSDGSDVAQNVKESVKGTVESAKEKVKDTAYQSKEKVKEAANKSKEAASDAAEKVKSKTQEIGEKARSTADEFRRQAKE